MGVHPEFVKDDFFTRSGTLCDRCNKKLGVYTMSWFTDEVICMSCSSKEHKIKKVMREQNLDPLRFEGCGYIPNLTVMANDNE